jgi:hypothetical protein
MIYAGPTISMICAVVPAVHRALSIGLLLTAMNLLGLGMGPLFIGFMADTLTGASNGLRVGMLIEALLYVPAAAFYVLASRTSRDDVSGAEYAVAGAGSSVLSR